MAEPKEEKTPEQIKQDKLNLRVNQFNEELKTLLGKYNLVLGAKPAFTPDGRTVAMPQLFDAEEIKKQAEGAKPGAEEVKKDEALSEA